MGAAGPGSRRRARMLRTTSAEWTPSLERLGAGRLDFGQAVGQDGGEKLHLTICRSPSSEPASLRRMRSRAPGRTQSLNGAPLRSAPGLRASTGT